MTPEQEIKAQLIVLSEYLQCHTLSDAQVRLYATELADLGPEGVRAAISALKADESVWPGRFPLPAKLRSYILGTIDNRVSESLRRILSHNGREPILSRLEHRVAADYGWKTIFDRNTTSTPTISAQLRDLLRAAHQRQQNEARLGLPEHSPRTGIEAQKPTLVSVPARSDLDQVVVPGRPFDESEG